MYSTLYLVLTCLIHRSFHFHFQVYSEVIFPRRTVRHVLRNRLSSSSSHCIHRKKGKRGNGTLPIYTASSWMARLFERRTWGLAAGEQEIRKDYICMDLANCQSRRKELIFITKVDLRFFRCFIELWWKKSASKFWKNIRVYNLIFTFISIGAKIDNKINKKLGSYVFRING